MGLTIGERHCINCKEYTPQIEEMLGKTIEEAPKRGHFRIPFICENCGADMTLVYFDNAKRFSWAVSYRCTNNDEPCYDEDCSMCSSNKGQGWWEN